MANSAVERVGDDYKIRWVDNIPFWGVHVTAIIGVIALGFSWSGLILAGALFFARMFGITAGYHRYFSHRSYKATRPFQFFLALLGTICTQKGVLWWAAHHRHHHKYSDQEEDIHSVRYGGFYWSHQGWILVNKYYETKFDRIKDFAKYPELRFLNRFHLLFNIAFAVALYLIGGVHALMWGFFVSTVLLWHGTFFINSLAHVWGKQRYRTTDDSKNNFWLALLTMGEGWHNNHHYYQRSCAQGFYWWEIDMTYYILKVCQWMRLCSGVSRPPRHVREDASQRYDNGEPADSPALVTGPVRLAEPPASE